jgi:hypothetical protein
MGFFSGIFNKEDRRSSEEKFLSGEERLESVGEDGLGFYPRSDDQFAWQILSAVQDWEDHAKRIGFSSRSDSLTLYKQELDNYLVDFYPTYKVRNFLTKQGLRDTSRRTLAEYFKAPQSMAIRAEQLNEGIRRRASELERCMRLPDDEERDSQIRAFCLRLSPLVEELGQLISDEHNLAKLPALFRELMRRTGFEAVATSVDPPNPSTVELEQTRAGNISEAKVQSPYHRVIDKYFDWVSSRTNIEKKYYELRRELHTKGTIPWLSSEEVAYIQNSGFVRLECAGDNYRGVVFSDDFVFFTHHDKPIRYCEIRSARLDRGLFKYTLEVITDRANKVLNVRKSYPREHLEFLTECINNIGRLNV